MELYKEGMTAFERGTPLVDNPYHDDDDDDDAHDDWEMGWYDARSDAEDAEDAGDIVLSPNHHN